MNRLVKRLLAVAFAVSLCALLGLSSFAATANEYGLGLTTEQKRDQYVVTLRNRNSFPVNGVALNCRLPDELRTSGNTGLSPQLIASGQSLTLKLPLTEASGFIGANGSGVRKSTAAAVVASVAATVIALAVFVVVIRKKQAAQALAVILAVFLLLPCFNLLQVNAWGAGQSKSFVLQDTVTVKGKEYPVTVTVHYQASTAKNSYFETTVAPSAGDGSTVTEYVASLSGTTVAAGRVTKVTYEVAAAVDGYAPETVGEAVMDGCDWSVDRFDLKPGDNRITVTSTLDDGRTQSESYSLTYDNGELYRCRADELRREGGTEYVNGVVDVFFRNGTSPQRADEIIRSLGGVRVGESYASDLYQARVDANNLEELQDYCDRFEQFEEVSLAVIEQTVDLQTNTVPNDSWYMASPTWDPNYPRGYNWSVTAVDAPGAWDHNGEMSHVNVGVVEYSSIFTAHRDFDDLIRFPDGYEEKNSDLSGGKAQHGTHVAGTIGAAANNNLDITGLLWDTNVYAANILNNATLATFVEAVVDEILAGARAVNLSLGKTNLYNPNSTRNPYLNPISDSVLNSEAQYCIAALKNLIADGKEFVIVQSAGNGVQDTRLGCDPTKSAAEQSGDWFRSVDAVQNGFLCAVKKKVYTGVTLQEATAVYDRILVVGAAENLSESNGSARFRMWRRSNGGSRVDIYAPGVRTVSTCVDAGGTQSILGAMTGTSQAAPIVTAVAGACFAVNPALTGAQVKQIICDEANTTRLVEDNTELFAGTPASADAELEYHPFTGDGRMVNMKLCVEAALRTVSHEEPTLETDDDEIVIDRSARLVVTTMENAADLDASLTVPQGCTLSEQANDKGVWSTGAQLVLSKAGCDDVVYELAVVGDVDGDAVIDGYDAYLVGLYTAGLLPMPQGARFAASDADGDGAVSGSDRQLLERAALKTDALLNRYQTE